VRLAVDLSLAGIGHNGPPYDVSALALFARMAVQPDDWHKVAINDLIVALKAAGVWSKLVSLYVLAAHSSQAALLNWLQDAYNCVAINSPTFTTDRGFTPDGSTSYLSTGFNPSTAGSALFTRNNMHMGCWVGTNLNSGAQSDMGLSSYANICSRNGASAQVRIMSSTLVNLNISPSDSTGWICTARPDSANVEVVKNLGTTAATANASAALPNSTILIGAGGFGSSGASAYGTRRVQAAHFGAYLNDAERDAFYTALSAYQTAVGA
jgi:hypothetical protein